MLPGLTRVQTFAADYVTDKVDLEILNLQPTDGTEIISPGEDFKFLLRATNADTQNGGVRLINVIWHVWIEHPDVSPNTVMFVPELANLHVRDSLDVNFTPLNPGTRRNEMFIFPQGGRGVLDVDETNEIEIFGEGTTAHGGAEGEIKFELFADLDLAIPQSQSGNPIAVSIDVQA